MLLCITGLHASGKSHFCKNVAIKFGYKRVNKKKLLENICKNEMGNEVDWLNWYRVEYNKNPIKMTKKIIEELPLNENIILDAVHSYKEWKIIQSFVPDALMIAVTTPQNIRASRWEINDEIKDLKRIQYWHSDYKGKNGCLLTQISWTFNGAAPDEVNEISFNSFLDYLKTNNLVNETNDGPKILTNRRKGD